jgi:hypothetical protein
MGADRVNNKSRATVYISSNMSLQPDWFLGLVEHTPKFPMDHSSKVSLRVIDIRIDDSPDNRMLFRVLFDPV